ncbi:MAG: hypothetical protein EOO39_08035, partial [Cytophagaceae bacterium]
MADFAENADRSFGDKLLGFFIKEDPASKTVPAAQPAPNRVAQPVSTGPVAAPTQSGGGSGPGAGSPTGSV